MTTRAVVVLGAVLIGGQVAGNLPHDQTLIFPVGSVFPHATRFAASWKLKGSREALGGVTRSFNAGPPLQIREHARLPDGDYIVTVDILENPETVPSAGAAESSGSRAGLQTNFDRRVNLVGGETMVALARPREAERL